MNNLNNNEQNTMETPVKKVFNPALAVIGRCHNVDELNVSTKSINYITGSDGFVYEVRKTPIGTFTKRADKVLGADNIQEGFEWNLPKIPFTILLEIVSFFRAVCNEFANDESMVQVFYDRKNNKYFNYCLKQSTSKVSVFFERNTELESDENYQLVMDIHSHNTMDAFFSGTDDNDEKETRLYGVFGKLLDNVPKYKFRMGVAGRFHALSIKDIFELPQLTMNFGDLEINIPVSEDNLMFPEVEFPEEWMIIIREGKKNLASFRPAKTTTDLISSDRIVSTGIYDDNYSYVGNLVDDDDVEIAEPFETEEALELADTVSTLGIDAFYSFMDHLITQGLEDQIKETLTDLGVIKREI